MTASNWKPRVLLVDDEPREIEVMGLVLERQGLDVALASSPAEAITRLGKEDFDAVVTDVVFHGYSDGARVLEAARKLAPEAIVVLMTGYPAIEGAVSAIKGGALDYLQKPVAPVVLAATIHRALREKRMAQNSLSFGELVDILSELVAQTIERVDPYTAGHGERTRKYCRIMAEQVGMDVATRERLELAAIAHDYGKIYLDDLSFLTKNGPLTAEEYREVQRHPLLGAEKLPRHEQLTDVARFVAEHTASPAPTSPSLDASSALWRSSTAFPPSGHTRTSGSCPRPGSISRISASWPLTPSCWTSSWISWK